MTDEKMLALRVELRALADSTSLVLLHGTELNIAADGSVDWDEDFLSGFDMCVASVQTENPIPKHMNLRRGDRVSSSRAAGARRRQAPPGWRAMAA
jgi:histidinol phosphatase-like PHP family hydrolase